MNYIKNREVKKLGRKLAVLYLLNLSDLFFTNVLLGRFSEFFYEANKMMRPMVNTIYMYILKVGVILLILLYWYYRSRKSDDKQYKRSIIASEVLIGIYSIINLIHLINLGIVIYNQVYLALI